MSTRGIWSAPPFKNYVNKMAEVPYVPITFTRYKEGFINYFHKKKNKIKQYFNTNGLYVTHFPLNCLIITIMSIQV